MSGEIPQSNALLEASADGPGASLAELFSRDPEGLQAQDRKIIIEAMRAHRARLEKAESEGKSAPRVKAADLLRAAPKDVGDMGL